MNKYGLISVIFFAIAAMLYVFTMFSVSGNELVPGKVMILFVVILPLAGLLMAFKSRGGFKAAGIIGNSLILVLSAVIPLASLLFWNQP
ncbi:hypothetical protein [Rossellomorea sp. NS-SX7]|uniref:hypothetical protein n=1 Tax=Rossellomorea sp. NS-SX7 TaxID=3463856 RepID=UPI004058387B